MASLSDYLLFILQATRKLNTKKWTRLTTRKRYDESCAVTTNKHVKYGNDIVTQCKHLARLCLTMVSAEFFMTQKFCPNDWYIFLLFFVRFFVRFVVVLYTSCFRDWNSPHIFCSSFISFESGSIRSSRILLLFTKVETIYLKSAQTILRFRTWN